MKKTLTLILILAMTLAACSSGDDSAETYPNRPSQTTESFDDTTETTSSFGYATETTSAASEVTRRDDRGVYGDPQDRSDRDAYRDTEFEDPGTNPVTDALEDRFSTFGLDVDTGSYTIARAYVLDGNLPDPDGIRVEEFVNFFQQDYPAPRSGEGFVISVDGGETPFTNRWTRVVRVGIQAEAVEDRPNASLTFVVDSSGSMEQGRRLEIVKDSLRTLVSQLHRDDTVAIVEFGDRASIVLEPTAVRFESTIVRAIDRLRPGGSTNFEDGLRMGYDLANEAFLRDGINRVIVASDGVANVGLEDPDSLAELIARDADRGIDLITIGVELGNYNDVLLEQLADQGDGFYAYVDTADEAERLFVSDLTGSLLTVGKDAKVQVEFNPTAVIGYRLIGFENRDIADRDFRNDAVDAGELGSGHTVTALYEVELSDEAIDGAMEIGRVNLRWLDPDTLIPSEIAQTFTTADLEDRFESTSVRFQQGVIVAQYAEILRGSPHADLRSVDDLVPYVDTLETFIPRDSDVAEFARLVRRAARLGA